MTPTALVADDDPVVRSILTIYLAAGYAVTAVADGAAAERALLADPGLAVAVLDCDMPGTTGPEALARARAAGCRVPVLLVSGSSTPPPAAPTDDPPTAFLAKPFRLDTFAAALAALLTPPV